MLWMVCSHQCCRSCKAGFGWLCVCICYVFYRICDLCVYLRYVMNEGSETNCLIAVYSSTNSNNREAR